eukprot:scaffold16350_cov61-Phaeocystis_antarctica.AAC.4
MADGRAIKITAHSHEPATKGVGCASRESIPAYARSRRDQRGELARESGEKHVGRSSSASSQFVHAQPSRRQSHVVRAVSSHQLTQHGQRRRQCRVATSAAPRRRRPTLGSRAERRAEQLAPRLVVVEVRHHRRLRRRLAARPPQETRHLGAQLPEPRVQRVCGRRRRDGVDGTGLRRARRDELEQPAQTLPLGAAVGVGALHEAEASEAYGGHECLEGGLLSRRRSQCARRHADARRRRRQRRQRRRGLHHLGCGGGTLVEHGQVALQRRRLEQPLPRQPRVCGRGVSPRRRAEQAGA